jgi:hypothetical protein
VTCPYFERILVMHYMYSLISCMNIVVLYAQIEVCMLNHDLGNSVDDLERYLC